MRFVFLLFCMWIIDYIPEKLLPDFKYSSALAYTLEHKWEEVSILNLV